MPPKEESAPPWLPLPEESAPPWLPLPVMLPMRRVVPFEGAAYDAYEVAPVIDLLTRCAKEIQILWNALQRVREENAATKLPSEQLFEMLCDLHTSAAPPPKKRVRELSQELRVAIVREFILAGGAS